MIMRKIRRVEICNYIIPVNMVLIRCKRGSSVCPSLGRPSTQNITDTTQHNKQELCNIQNAKSINRMDFSAGLLGTFCSCAEAPWGYWYLGIRGAKFKWTGLRIHHSSNHEEFPSNLLFKECVAVGMRRRSQTNTQWTYSVRVARSKFNYYDNYYNNWDVMLIYRIGSQRGGGGWDKA